MVSEKKKSSTKARNERRIDAHECIECGTKMLDERKAKRCSTCIARSSASRRKTEENRKQNKCCVKCGEELPSDCATLACQTCLHNTNKTSKKTGAYRNSLNSQKKKRKRLKDEGRCFECEDELIGDDTDNSTCSDCRKARRDKEPPGENVRQKKANVDVVPIVRTEEQEKNWQYQITMRASRSETGICCRCGKYPAREGLKTCQRCAVSQQVALMDIRDRKKTFLIDLLGGKCTRCREKCRWMFALDHIEHTDRKEHKKSVMSMSFEALKEEVKVLQLLCINCHSIKTTKEDFKLSNKRNAVYMREKMSKRRAIFDTHQLETGCQWPGCSYNITDAAQLQYDHKDPSAKSFNISTMYNMTGYTEEMGWSEVGKCAVLCGNHHNVRSTLQYWDYCVWKDGFPTIGIDAFIQNVRKKAIADACEEIDADEGDNTVAATTTVNE